METLAWRRQDQEKTLVESTCGGKGHTSVGLEPCPGPALPSIPGSKHPEQSDRASFPVFDVGHVGDGMNEPRLSINKPGPPNMSLTGSHKAQAGSRSPRHVQSRILPHCVCSIKLSVGNAGSREPAKPKQCLCFPTFCGCLAGLLRVLLSTNSWLAFEHSQSSTVTAA